MVFVNVINGHCGHVMRPCDVVAYVWIPMLSVGHSATVRVHFKVWAMGTDDLVCVVFVNVNNGNCGVVT